MTPSILEPHWPYDKHLHCMSEIMAFVVPIGIYWSCICSIFPLVSLREGDSIDVMDCDIADCHCDVPRQNTHTEKDKEEDVQAAACGWQSLKNWMFCSPPARWGLLDFMSVASSSFSSSSPPPPRPPCRPRRPRRPCSTATRDPQCSLPDLNHDHPRPVFPAGPQPRPSTPNVPCRTSTTTILAQRSLPDLNHDHPRPVFPAGPQPRVSTPSVPCRTSCRKIWDKECAEES